MNILINCSTLKVGGGIQVAHSFINGLKTNKVDEFIIVCSSVLLDQLNINDFDDNFEFLKFDTKPSVFKIFTGKNSFLDLLVKDKSIERVFTVFGPSYWKPKVKHICGYAKPHYVYKDSPFFKTLSFKNFLKIRLMEFFHMYDFNYNNCELITENIDVTNRLSIRLKKNIHTVTNYYNQVFDEKYFDTKYSSSNTFKLLTISANYPHKNLSIIPKIIEKLCLKYPDFNFQFIVSLQKNDLDIDKEFLDKIKFLGKVKIEDCPRLYNESNVLFLPTLLECFTASYCEAMRMEKPIITSNLNFAKGLCKDSAIYIAPLDPDDIAKKIFELANNTELQKVLIKNGKEQLKLFDNYTERTKKYLQIIKNETNHTIL